MNADLVSIIFTAMAVGFMAVAMRTRESVRFRIAAVWIAAAAVAFLIPFKGAAFLLLALVLTGLAPRAAPIRIGLYAASFMALPDYFAYDIPFPGINYLIDIEFGKLATIVFLGPVFLTKVFAPGPAPLKIVDRLLLIFVLVSGLMTFRDLPLTSVIRATVDQFILIYVPYIAISRSLTTVKDFERVLHAFLAGLVVLAAIGVISVVREWNFYAGLGEGIDNKIYSSQRSGFLRIYGTITPPLLALSMGAGIVCAAYLRSKSELPAYLLLTLIALFASVMFVTGSRGGILGAVVTMILYFTLPRIGSAARAALALVSCISIIGLILYVLQESVTVYDPYGTFQYRIELLRTSIDQIARRPLFGSANFFERPEFEALRQGEGIIDVVNAYLRIALSYGLVGLALYVGANGAALFRVYGSMNAMEKRHYKTSENRAELKRLCALVVALHAGYLVLIFTTSGVSWVWNYGYLILALQVALAKIIVFAENHGAAQKLAAAPGPAADDARGENRKRPPYGARFVRRI